MEENKVMEATEVEEQQTANETPEEEQGGGGLIVGVLLGLGALAAGGLAIYRKATAKRREARQIADLEKKGYVIVKPETDGEETESESEDK